MDTYQKNRSGDQWNWLSNLYRKINLKHDNRYIHCSKNFNYLQKNFGIKVSASIRNRKADFILINADEDRVINIEVNFIRYSKPRKL